MFPLNPEQDSLRRNATSFARRHLAADLDKREPRSEFSRADWDRLGEAGFAALFREAPLSAAARLEGLGAGCADNGLLMSLHAHLWGCALPIHQFGSGKILESLLNELARGQRIGANAATERSSGSDFLAMETRAERRGDRFVVNGRKSYVTNAPLADVFLVYAKTAADRSIRSISAFLVQRSDPGVSFGAPYVKSGLRTSPLAELRLENCELGPEKLLGDPGDGLLVFNRSLQWERALVLSSVVGSMERLLGSCLEYTRSRKLGGRAVSDFGGVKRRLVAMKTRHEASRLLVYRAARALTEDADSMLLSSLAKRAVSEWYVESCQDAMAVFGAEGLMADRGIERELRDAMASVVYSGTSDVQEEIIANLL